ncbi:unnamed protein product [marine sediment metagenome]|uniref:Uncharacterized protein n=1 Tax=marine sediment metagenome TaxID=412755 RepID=X1A8U3_9ZZZZ
MAITSSTPGIPKIIKIDVTSGTKGQALTVRDRSDNQNVLNITLPTTAQAIVDLQNFTNNYTSGDIIDFIVSGAVEGHNSLTTSGDAPQVVEISTAAVSTGVAKGI